MCSYSILPPYHHLLLHLSFLQHVPTLSSVLLLFPILLLLPQTPVLQRLPYDLETLTELTEEARDFRFIRIIRNELTF